ncbi:hypothetical protein [Conexibacter sp. S30A1]|uniref:hypothetical protein n=1 Tax=Conexibacter sp. S30A1 TaxID=2937800 RepID=UPI00200F4D4B|nr:hypothetical protein [Conexibacter sp. S30A1]
MPTFFEPSRTRSQCLQAIRTKNPPWIPTNFGTRVNHMVAIVTALRDPSAVTIDVYEVI